ncbi:MAG: pyridoxal 5'-phosphate synthase glutaminase subunit PdxT [Candidatus Eremiobacteraeota bacterium]|nr:pyridoxal 5'-phosphate synthase glutaminase subunit PdxT [Candidatus Eremiobacteraeota bacterium]MCW5866088.1 pyridoxal 5'-phosphate synthase glutaminase subunit PdxT [Candidatus Eremiobacteraeota bacterium]
MSWCRAVAAKPVIGVLALQGAFAEHEDYLRRAGALAVEVRRPDQLEELDGLILPGGESTTIGKLLRRFGFEEPLRRFDRPIWGTCAGMILLSREIRGGLPDQLALDRIDLRVTRNAFGRQADSFTAPLELSNLAEPIPAVFIRAPLAEPLSDRVEVLAEVDGQVAAARQANVWVSSFHPELSGDLRLHKSFVATCRSRSQGHKFQAGGQQA